MHVLFHPQELGQNYYKCLQEITNIQSVVLDQELASWKRMQRLYMCGQEESPKKKEVLDQLQQWCEQLADLLWRNRMQIMQVHRWCLCNWYTLVSLISFVSLVA